MINYGPAKITPRKTVSAQYPCESFEPFEMGACIHQIAPYMLVKISRRVFEGSGNPFEYHGKDLSRLANGYCGCTRSAGTSSTYDGNFVKGLHLFLLLTLLLFLLLQPQALLLLLSLLLLLPQA